MTTVYFIRHAESDFSVKEDRIRPLSRKGQQDRLLVTEFLADKGIDVVLSSPYKRAVDTVADFACKSGFGIEVVEDLRERRVDSVWVDDFKAFSQKQWADFSYKLSDGECLSEVQERNIAALSKILNEHKGKNIVIGTHGTALSTIINYYDSSYGYDDFAKIAGVMPWVVVMYFDGENCMGMHKIDLFNPDEKEVINRVVTCPLGELKAYRFVVIFARYRDKWLYCRHKKRDTYETPGGHIEESDGSPLEAAKRELCEESGAVEFDIVPAFDYNVYTTTGYAIGQVFLAHIHELGELPVDFEMAEVRLFDTVPDKMRFPQILPVLYEKVREMI